MNGPSSAPIKAPFVLKIEDLKRVVNLILDHILVDLDVRAVEINPRNELYWNMGAEMLHDMENENPQLDVGSLTDDWHFLSKVDNREEAVSLLLIHAAPLLRYVGERVGQ